MGIPLYLAMTEQEMAECPQLPPKIGWMACHFSPYALGLTDLPGELPPGALLCCDDRIPVLWHKPELVARQLSQTAEALSCAAILMDLQRPDVAVARETVALLCETPPCPIVATAEYAKDCDAAVFLPPPALWKPMEQTIAQWQGREIWLEWAPQSATIGVTARGAEISSGIAPFDRNATEVYTDEALMCRYRWTADHDQASFFLWDDAKTMAQKMEQAEALGVTALVGLFQEFNRPHSRSQPR